MNTSPRLKILIVAFIVLAGAFATSSSFAIRANDDMDHAFEVRFNLSSAMYELNLTSEILVRWARAFIITGGQFQYNAYWYELELDRTGRALEAFMFFGAPQNEIELLDKIIERRTLINEIQYEAIRLRTEGYVQEAIDRIHSPELTYLGIPLSGMVQDLIELMNNRTQEMVEYAMRRAAIFRTLMIATTIMFALAGIFGLNEIGKAGTSKSVRILAILFAVLAAANVFFSVSAASFSREKSDAFEYQAALTSAVYNTELSTEVLSRWMRMFAVTGEEEWHNSYLFELERDRFGHGFDTFINLRAPASEINLLVELVSRIIAMRQIDDQIIQMRIAGYHQEAIDMAFGPDFITLSVPTISLSKDLREATITRTLEELDSVRQSYNTYVILIVITSSLHGITGLGALLIKLKEINQSKNLRVKQASNPTYQIIKHLKNTSIAAKLIISFSLIISIFIVYISIGVYFDTVIDNLNRHNNYFVTARAEILLTYHQEFTEKRRLIRESFMNPEWLESTNEGIWRSFERRLSASNARLTYLGESYKESLRADQIFPEMPDDSRIFILTEIMSYADAMYEIYSTNFFLEGDMNFNHENVLDYAGTAEILIQVLLRIVDANKVSLAYDIEQYRNLSNTITVTLLVMTIGLAILLAWSMVKSFTGKIKSIESNAALVAKGNFETELLDGTDEISKIFSELVGTFTRLMTEINDVTDENKRGNSSARINPEHFQGGYKETAIAINTLLDAVADMMFQKEMVKAAQKNSEAKSRFLARMSHEIRTPISTVLGISEIQLQNPDLSPQIEESFAKIHSSSNILLGIINDILDLSKIEAEKMTIYEEKYDVASMISDVAQLHFAYLSNKNIAFRMCVHEELPAFLLGDPLRIKQIVNNLLSNAFKYTEAGSVELSLQRQKNEKPDYITLAISIKDTGLGMSSSQLDLLYKDYTRFHETEKRFIGGTGLGMPIVYSLVQMMGAHIELKSKKGKGTQVVVTIPQKMVDTEVLGKETALRFQQFEMDTRHVAKRFNFTPEPMPYGTVLVVDDLEANLYVTKGLLAFYSLKVETCENGQESIDKIKQGKVYDIIFMDHMMPGLDGLETTRILRDMGYTQPIIALTANALIGQAEEFMQNGFDGFISKPIGTNHLNTILIRHIRDKQSPEVLAAKATTFEHPNDQPISHGSLNSANPTNPINIEDFQNQADIVEKLRIDFARTQKNAFTDISQALKAGDIKTAHLLVHSLKSVAGLIKEDVLATIARDMEDILAAGETLPPNYLSVLENELTQVLNSISEPESQIVVDSVNFDKDKALVLLDNLELLLNSHNTDCLDLLDELRTIPETAVLIRQIEEFEFMAAVSTLQTLRTIL